MKLLRCFLVLGVAVAGALLPVRTMSAADAVSSTAFDPAERIATLRTEIAAHDERYFRHAQPVIDDAAYDALRRELAALEAAHPEAAARVPPLAPFGDDRTGAAASHRHPTPLLSLEKAYAYEALRAFCTRTAAVPGAGEVAWVIEPKFDGLAVNLIFVAGRFERALTRGDGTQGEDITGAVRALPGFPAELPVAPGIPRPERLEIRGELYVPWADFVRINAERETAGAARFVHPRQLAVGTARQRDPGEVARRGLRLVCFGFGGIAPESAAPPTLREGRRRLEAWGLPVPPQIWTASSADEAVAAVAAVGQARREFPFPTDGAVIKVDDLARRRALGDNDTGPRWALAFKFPPDRVATVLLAINVQVGRTGALTPVAEFAPVKLGGATVTRATLHNREDLARRDLRVGDTVWVEKSGDVIPVVAGVDFSKRPGQAVPFVFPRACPECRTETVEHAADAGPRCPNDICPAQARRRLEHFVAPAAVNVPGFGPALIAALVASGHAARVPDLYRLRAEDLAALPRVGPETAARLLAALETSRRAELWRWLYGLGLPQIGEVKAKEWARRHRSLAALADALPEHALLFQELAAAGVQPTPPTATTGPLAGNIVVLTGVLPTLTRTEAAAAIEAAGGAVAATVTRATTLVVAGEGAGAKLESARRLGIPVIAETELRRRLRGP